LASDVGLSSVTDISVNSTNGIVTLSGEVASENVKSQAVTAAKSIPKVVRVIDNIQIAPKSVRLKAKTLRTPAVTTARSADQPIPSPAVPPGC
jgi:hypothetical protein